MVTVVRNTNSSQMLGQAAGQGVGQGFAKGAGQALDFSQQQRNVNRVLKPLEALMNDPNATADQRAMAMLRASTVVPAAANLIPYYMGQSARKSSAGAMTLPGGKPMTSGSVPGQKVSVPGGQSNQPLQQGATTDQPLQQGATTDQPLQQGATTDQPLQQGATPVSSNAEPTPKGSSFQQPVYTPTEITQRSQWGKDNNEPPEVTKAFVDDMLLHNANADAQEQRNVHAVSVPLSIAKGKIELDKSKLDLDVANLNKSSSVLKAINDSMPGTIDNPELLNNARKLYEDTKNANPDMSDEKILRSIVKPITDLKLRLKKFERKTARNKLTGASPDQRFTELAHEAKELSDLGFGAQVELMVAKGDYGEVGDAKIRDPLNDMQQQKLKELPYNFLRNNDDMLLGPADSATLDYSNKLVPLISSGANLILIRNELLEKVGSWQAANRVMIKAIDNNNIQLSTQQKKDRISLSGPPLDADGYFTKVLKSWIGGYE